MNQKTNQEAPFREAQLEEVQKLIKDGYDLVDVRDYWEWNKGHIPGARHVFLDEILKAPQSQKFRDRTVFVCAVGNRSAIAAEMAVALGAKDVVNFRGGTDAWKKAGLPLDIP
jgi:rhodanese-related sulfurtransferase